MHPHERLRGVARLDRLPHRLSGRSRREPARVQGNFDPHAGVEGAHGRNEQRRGPQPRVLDHLGDVLVHPLERVGRRVREREEPVLGILPALDQRPPPARVSGERVDGDRGVAREESLLEERPQPEDDGRRVAAGVRDPGGLGDARPLLGLELGQPEDPARRHSMGGARVEHAHVGFVDPVDRIASGLVGKAEDDDVRAVQGLPSSPRVLALGPVERDEHQVVPVPELLVDPESGRPGVAVDKDARPAHYLIVARGPIGARPAPVRARRGRRASGRFPRRASVRGTGDRGASGRSGSGPARRGFGSRCAARRERA